MMSALRQISDFGDMVGKYWANDNAQFESSNPSTLRRLGRAFNPMTGLGSALGNFYTSVGNGDWTGSGLAAASAMPMFLQAVQLPKAAARFNLAKGTALNAPAQTVIANGLRSFGHNAAVNVADDSWERYKDAR